MYKCIVVIVDKHNGISSHWSRHSKKTELLTQQLSQYGNAQCYGGPTYMYSRRQKNVSVWNQ